jgi:hypothetical protein
MNRIPIQDRGTPSTANRKSPDQNAWVQGNHAGTAQASNPVKQRNMKLIDTEFGKPVNANRPESAKVSPYHFVPSKMTACESSLNTPKAPPQHELCSAPRDNTAEGIRAPGSASSATTALSDISGPEHSDRKEQNTVKRVSKTEPTVSEPVRGASRVRSDTEAKVSATP